MPIHGAKRLRESFSAKKRSSSADESGNAEWLILIRHRKSPAPGRSGVDEHRGAGRLDNANCVSRIGQTILVSRKAEQLKSKRGVSIA
jgi:hypothetical protein